MGAAWSGALDGSYSEGLQWAQPGVVHWRTATVRGYSGHSREACTGECNMQWASGTKVPHTAYPGEKGLWLVPTGP